MRDAELEVINATTGKQEVGQLSCVCKAVLFGKFKSLYGKLSMTKQQQPVPPKTYSEAKALAMVQRWVGSVDQKTSWGSFTHCCVASRLFDLLILQKETEWNFQKPISTGRQLGPPRNLPFTDTCWHFHGRVQNLFSSAASTSNPACGSAMWMIHLWYGHMAETHFKTFYNTSTSNIPASSLRWK